MERKKVRIAVAAHKPYPMPKDPIYIPLFVGAALHPERRELFPETFACDDTGENISEKNPGFCELTALYWAWREVDADYVGLVHYRRHFAGPGRKGTSPDDAITGEELEVFIPRCSIFVPKERNYVIETLSSHYAHTHDARHLHLTRWVLSRLHPEDLPFFDSVMKKRGGHMFNMMIMRDDRLDSYCRWLFPILFELEKCMAGDPAYAGLSDYNRRLYGRVSELLLNVYLERGIAAGEFTRDEIMELPYFGTERTNWVKKGGSFLMARFFKKKYSGSF